MAMALLHRFIIQYVMLSIRWFAATSIYMQTHVTRLS